MADIKVAAKEALQTLWAAVCDAFQVKLVSGENIKTVNGSSLLGSGNIAIGGSYTLPAATSSTLGGVKVREDFGLTMAGTNSEFITQLIEMSVTEAMPDLILTSTSSTVAADPTGWHLADVYSDEQAGFVIRRASGMVYGGAVINTSIGGQYRSSSLYIPLPENTYGLVWVSPLGFGCGLGGSSVAGMGALLGGSAASWQYEYGIEKQNLNVMLTAPTSGTGTRYVYFPIEIMYAVI